MPCARSTLSQPVPARSGHSSRVRPVAHDDLVAVALQERPIELAVAARGDIKQDQAKLLVIGATPFQCWCPTCCRSPLDASAERPATRCGTLSGPHGGRPWPCSRFATSTIHGHDVAYRLAGEGETILLDPRDGGELAHMARGDARACASIIGCWRPTSSVTEPRERKRRTTRSARTPSMLRDLMDRLGIDRATVVGQSLGGGVAMQFAYQFPERCDRLVLVSSGGLGRDVSLILRALSLPGAESCCGLVTPAFVRELGNALSAWLCDQGVRPGGWPRCGAPTPRSATPRADGLLPNPPVGRRPRRSSSQRNRPPLSRRGDADVDHLGRRRSDHPGRPRRSAHAAMPGSRLEILEGVGHFPQSEAPKRFVEVLSDFVDSTAADADRDRTAARRA